MRLCLKIFLLVLVLTYTSPSSAEDRLVSQDGQFEVQLTLSHITHAAIKAKVIRGKNSFEAVCTSIQGRVFENAIEDTFQFQNSVEWTGENNEKHVSTLSFTVQQQAKSLMIDGKRNWAWSQSVTGESFHEDNKDILEHAKIFAGNDLSNFKIGEAMDVHSKVTDNPDSAFFALRGPHDALYTAIGKNHIVRVEYSLSPKDHGNAAIKFVRESPTDDASETLETDPVMVSFLEEPGNSKSGLATRSLLKERLLKVVDDQK